MLSYELQVAIEACKAHPSSTPLKVGPLPSKGVPAEVDTWDVGFHDEPAWDVRKERRRNGSQA